MPAAAICIGRKKKLVASDLQVAVKALHLPHTSDVALGISIKRLQFAGCKAIEWRQQDGVGIIVSNSKLARKVNAGLPPEKKLRAVHVTYAHLWDEVDTKFRPKVSKLGNCKLATRCQVIVQ